MRSTPSKHMTYFALMESLDGDGCPLCIGTLRTLERYFDGLVYEKVNDLGVRDTLRASQGFCGVHGEMLRQARSALGAAIIHRDLVNSLVKKLEQGPQASSSLVGWLRSRGQTSQGWQDVPLSTAVRCPACVQAQETESSYADALLDNWQEEALQAGFRSSPGLCVPHLRTILSRAADPAVLEAIKAAQVEIWQRLLVELDEFIRKQDYRFSSEPWGNERDAWSRAIDLVSGLWQVSGSHR